MKEMWEIHWKDYYSILQIHPLAELEVVRKAYQTLAMKYHPDHNNATTEQRMKDLTEAFEIIGDAEKRNRYYKVYCTKINFKHTTTQPSKSKSKSEYNSPPKRTATMNTHHRPYNKAERSNLHAKGKYSKDTGTKIITIILIAIALSILITPWYMYITVTSWRTLWLIISILLSIPLVPIIFIWVQDFFGEIKQTRHQGKPANPYYDTKRRQ